MKKLFLVLMTLALSLGAHAIDYDAYITAITGITDESTTSYYGGVEYKYVLEFKQKGLSRSDGGTYSTEACYVIYPKTHDLAGTFSAADGTLDMTDSSLYGSYILYGSKYRFSKSSTEITITKNQDGSYTLSGAMYCTTGHNYFYDAADSRNTFNFSPYDSEGNAKNFTFTASNVAAEDNTSSGSISLFLNDEDSDYVELVFNASSFAIPAGDYAVTSTGAAGTILASPGGFLNYSPTPSVVQMMGGWDSVNYYITGGTVTVAYPDDKTIKVTGTVTSKKGSQITLDATCDNPFYVPDPETYTLTVSSVAAVFAYDNTYFGLSIGAKNGEKTCNGYVKVLDDEIVGEFGNADLSTNTYFGSCYLDNTDADNKVSIVATGNENEYKLNLRLRLDDNNIYVIKDAVFTYVAPTPFDPEPDTPTTIDATFDSEPYIYNEGASKSRIVLEFMSSDGSYIDLAFTAKALADILPCHYLVNDSKALGTVQASAGRVSGEDTPSFFAKGIGFFDYNPYYITGGELDVTFLANGMLRITGVLTTAKGSTVNVNISGKNTVNKNALPENVINGYVLGTDATYMFAYDVTTDASGYVTVDATAWTDKTVEGFKPQITIGEDTADMSYDAATGACSYKIPSSYSKGDKVKVGVSFTYGAGSTKARTIDYVVE